MQKIPKGKREGGGAAVNALLELKYLLEGKISSNYTITIVKLKVKMYFKDFVC